ncbi:MAG: hypothetical protein J0L67_09895 [Cytophagales bacterium]|nr:hypothetical protein [Cytophagales bacterium]
MDIKETILRFLYKKNNGRLTDITEILEPFDNDRQSIRGTLFTLQKDKLIEVDNDFDRLIISKQGQFYPLTSIHLLARLTITGQSYFKEHYMTDDKENVKIKIKNLQNISNSTVGQVNQDLERLSSKVKNTNTPMKEDMPQMIKNVLIGILVIGGLILYFIFGIG